MLYGTFLSSRKRLRKSAVCLLLLHLFSGGISDDINQGFGVGVGVGVGVGQVALTQTPDHGPSFT